MITYDFGENSWQVYDITIIMCEQIVTVGRMSSVGTDIVLLKNYYLMTKTCLLLYGIMKRRNYYD